MNFIIYIILLVVVQVSLQNVTISDKHNRIHKGKLAEPHSTPYMVGIFVMKKNGSSVCGGSLIKTRFVLTSGNCLHNALSTKVLIGINSLQQAYKDKNWMEILNYKIHKNFNSYNLQNDIALIQLSMSVILSNKIGLVRLPNKSDTASLVGKYGILTGFGEISDYKTHLTDLLKELKVRLVSSKTCNVVALNSINIICGIGEDKGNACAGDTGSPLVLENSQIQIGINSHGSTLGCTQGYPDVYTNVASYLDWINKWSQ